jgi:hypothetical protein
MSKYGGILIIAFIVVALALPACSKGQVPDDLISSFVEEEDTTSQNSDPGEITLAEALPEQAKLDVEEQPFIYKTTANVNLREEPNTESDIITIVSQGTIVTVTDLLDGLWYLVDYKGQIGYINAEYLDNATKEQSLVPYLGFEEIKPFIAGLNTIEDWINDIQIQDVDFEIYVCQATYEPTLEISSNGRKLAEFVFEMDEQEVSKLFDLSSHANLSSKKLEAHYLHRKVTGIYFLDFKDMGIPYNLRGITNGSTVSDVKKAFLNMENDSEKMYGWKDVVPDAIVNEEDYGIILIGGLDDRNVSPEYNHDCSRAIKYYNTLPYSANDDGQQYYNIYHEYTCIGFAINDHEEVESMIFRDITHRN